MRAREACNLGAFRTAEEHRAILLGCWLRPRVVRPQLDTDYRGLPDDVFAEAVREARRPDPAYSNGFNCNHFTQTFIADMLRWWGEDGPRGEALEMGFVWLRAKGSAETHELAWVVNNLGEVRLWEPQTNARAEGLEVEECFEVWE